jgi:4'-phosphopantetheinyl transferase EntD
VIADIVPPPVAAAEAFGDLPDAELYPGEEAVIAHAVDKRRREFATGRACARTALAKLGVPGGPILPGSRGAPQWPPGVVGSITHCAGYRACAVALDRAVVAIGVDAEPNRELRDGALRAVCGEAEEVRILALQAAIPEVSWDRLLFSAKESVYKAWFPLTGRRLRFRDVCVDFDPVRTTFSARLLVDGPVVNGETLTGLDGRWVIGDGLLATAIVIPRRDLVAVGGVW